MCLIDLCHAIWRQRRLVTGLTIVCVVVAVALSYAVAPVYRADVLLSPVVREGAENVPSLVRQYAGLLGARAGGPSGLGRSELVAVLGARDLTCRFIRSERLMPILYADQWDPESESWSSPAGADTPTIQQACDLFSRGVRGIFEDRETGLVTLSVEWTEPELAAEWANGLVREANEYLREDAIEEGKRSIEFLNEELQRTAVSEVRAAIFSLMERQMQQIMLANVQEDYGYRVLDPAVTPERRVRPNRRLIALASFVVGAVASMGLAVLIDTRRGSWNQQTLPRNGSSKADPDGPA